MSHLDCVTTQRKPVLRDAVYGAVIGDALGVPFEGRGRGTFRCTGMSGYGTYNMPAGTWSDDSSLILATCRSLKENGGKIVLSDISDKFRQWYRDGRFTPFGVTFGCGRATSDAIELGKARSDDRSCGNGSLMRILPLAYVNSTDDEIRAVSAITHAHPIAQETCVIYVNIIKRMRKKDGIALREIVHGLHLPAPFDRLSYIDSLPESEIRSTGYVVDSLEAALWCVLTSEGYEECLLKAVNLGGDTDTVASLAGGLGAAVKYAPDSMKAEWIHTLQNRELIEDCLF